MKNKNIPQGNEPEDIDNKKNGRKKLNKKGKTAILIIFIILIAVCIVSGSLYFYFMPKSEILDISPRIESFTAVIKENEISSGYQLEVSTSETMDVDVQSYEGQETTFEVKELTAGSPYYARARAYKDISGIRIYSLWSDTRAVTPKGKPALKHIFAFPSVTKILLNKTMSITTILIPQNTGYKDIRYTSSDEKIATVDENGVVKGVGAGDAVITVSVDSTDVTAQIKIKVEKPFVATTGIKFTDKAGKTVEAGESIQLHANVIPKDATNQAIVWSVKDDTKAKVDSKGVVTGLRPTEYLEITAKTKDGKFSAKYILKVTKTKGYITNSDLDNLGLSSVDNLMIVAHPDDESLWGGSHLMNGKYLVVVLTNSYKSKRAAELKKAMSLSYDRYLILSYPDIKDTWYENGKYKYSVDKWTTSRDAIDADIKTVLNYKDWKVIATHNPNGEYGHYHHKTVSNMVTDAVKGTLSGDREFYYFGNWYSKNAKNPDPKLDDSNLKNKNNMVDAYLPSSPYAIANNRHMVQYESWIKYQDWESKKSR